MGVNKQNPDQDDGAESDQSAGASSISPLHAIPGFERISQRRLFPKGSLLFAEGYAPRGVYILCSGRVKLSLISAQGKTLIVRIARPGDMLGIHATLSGHAYEARAETLELSRVDFISRKDLRALLERQKSFGLALAIAISKELMEFVEHARVLLLAESASEKVARLLLRLGDEFGEQTTTGIRLQTLLTHEEIAQMIGTSRETVTRSLNVLKRRRVIWSRNGVLLIRNRDALAAVGQVKE